MVAKIMAIQRVDIANKNHRGATEGARKKNQKKVPFKEIFAREMAGKTEPRVTKV